MSDVLNTGEPIRFFSNSNWIQDPSKPKQQQKDPEPFGLQFQENFPDNPQPADGVTMGASSTYTSSGSDISLDIDTD